MNFQQSEEKLEIDLEHLNFRLFFFSMATRTRSNQADFNGFKAILENFYWIIYE